MPWFRANKTAWLRKRRDVEERSGEKCDVLPQQQLLQEQGNYCTPLPCCNKGLRAKVLEDCLQRHKNSHWWLARHWNRECRVDVARWGGDGKSTAAEWRDTKGRLEEIRSFKTSKPRKIKNYENKEIKMRRELFCVRKLKWDHLSFSLLQL